MNDAVNQALSRTVLTALTVFLSAAILLFLGGMALEDFAFVLLLGVVMGTHSTIYVAGALAVDWTRYAEGRPRRGSTGEVPSRTAGRGERRR
jgi:preprotein translocase subunit SecF